MNARNSITSKDEKLSNKQLKKQWNDIDWKEVEKHVNRLQVRITKAVKESKWYLVKRLQYLLTHSYFAKLLATRNPTQNTGKRTAGIDGETWSPPEAKMNPFLDKDYFILRKIKLGIKKLTDTANKVWNKSNNIHKPGTETMTDNCCPI